MQPFNTPPNQYPYELNFRSAAELLAHFGVSSPPVDVFQLAGLSGVRVWAASDPQWDGAIDMGPPPAIWVDQASTRTRQRFTVAHELGHYFLHRHRQRAFRDVFSRQGMDPFEIEANKFAAELLMPAAWVQAYARYEPAFMLAQRFDVSDQAMGIRLKNLGLG